MIKLKYDWTKSISTDSSLLDTMLQEKITSSQHVKTPSGGNTSDVARTTDSVTDMIETRMPVEIVMCEDEEKVDFPKEKQNGHQTDMQESVGSISPSIISAIDKHIMESIGTKYLDFQNMRPGFNSQRMKDHKSDLRELTISLQSKSSGEGGNHSLSKTPSNIVTKARTRPNETSTVIESIRKEEANDDKNKKDEKSKRPGTESQMKNVPKDKEKEEPATQDDDEVVWICFICAKGFRNQTDLMSHQDICEEDGEPIETDTKTGPSKSSNTLGTGSNSVNQMDSLNDTRGAECCSVNGSFGLENSRSIHDGSTVVVNQVESPLVAISEVDSQSNNSGSDTKPIPALLRKVGSNLKPLPLGLSSLSRSFPTRKRKRNIEIYIPPPRDTYFESLGLVPTPKVEKIKTPVKSGNPDCQIIDLTLETETEHNPHPMTPRTHLMMSQLSRDETTGARRRHLSFSQMTPTKHPKKVESDSESSDSSVEERVSRKNVPCKSVILAIPLTSLLGQRLKKHWQSDNKIPVIPDVEIYCQTSDVQYSNEDLEGNRKSKLRHRPPPQVTFKFTKKYINKWCHKFKFNKADKSEFERTLTTGLERESRRLLKKMKSCRVSLERMSEKDIKLHTQRRSKPLQYMSNLQLMRRNYNDQIRLSLLQSMPRNNRHQLQLLRSTNPQFSQIRHRLNTPLFTPSGPIPQFLVRNIPNGANRLNAEALPVVSKLYYQSVGTPMATPSGRYNQAFPVNDDTVICLSSDDDEEEIEVEPVPVACGKCKMSKEACVCQGRLSSGSRPRIGPASFMRHQQSLQQRAQVLRKSNTTSRTSSPVSMVVNTGKVDSASSRVFGKHYINSNTNPKTHMGNIGSHLNTAVGQSSAQKGQGTGSNSVQNTESNQVVILEDTSEEKSSQMLTSSFYHVQMVNGKVVHQVTGEGSMSIGSHTAKSFVPEPGSPSNVTNGTPTSDSEYMDYEVICIDSDDES